MTFIENLDLSKNVVNHIDGNKSNNKLENLEFVTSAESTQHAVKSGLFSSVSKIVRRNLKNCFLRFLILKKKLLKY